MSDNQSDNQNESSYPSTEYLTRLRNTALFYLVGGAILFLLRFIAGKLVLAIGAGGIIGAVGIGWLLANNPNNKKTGALLAGVGVLVMLSGIPIPILKIVTGTLIGILTIGALVMGVKHLIMYFIAQNKKY